MKILETIAYGSQPKKEEKKRDFVAGSAASLNVNQPVFIPGGMTGNQGKPGKELVSSSMAHPRSRRRCSAQYAWRWWKCRLLSSLACILTAKSASNSAWKQGSSVRCATQISPPSTKILLSNSSLRGMSADSESDLEIAQNIQKIYK